jgi:membrane fusion protein (multidrug efflux system)
MLLFGSVLLLAGLAWGVYWYLYDRWYESTDNAYVGGNVVQVTPQVAGTVTEVNADDTQHVKAGAVLIRLDPRDAEVAVQQAEADLAQVTRQVGTLYDNNDQYAAAVAAREAELARAKDDLGRRELAGGAVSREELDHAREAVRSAAAALASARAQLASNHTLIGGTQASANPNVAQAEARLRSARLNLDRTTIAAPLEGYIAQRAVQIGQRVAPGSVLMAVVPLEQVWVDANFTEKRLRRVRAGMKVELTSDFYGSGVVYHGSVAGFSPGTGSAFAMLPAQNATGNWIKVVQRLPVRIQLDSKELQEHPLRVGLSMQATIDLHDEGGAALVPGGEPQADGGAQKTSSLRSSFERMGHLLNVRLLLQPRPAAAAAPAPAAAAGAPAAAVQRDGWVIQVCSYKTRAEAEAGAARLGQHGFAPDIEEARVGHQTWYRLRSGPALGRKEVPQMLRRLAAAGYRGILVKAG